MEALQKDNKVSFCVYAKGFCKDGEWALNFKSVIVFGKIEIVEDFKTIAEITTKLISKVLLNYVEPTMMVSFLYLGAGIGLFLFGIVEKMIGKAGKKSLLQKKSCLTQSQW